MTKLYSAAGLAGGMATIPLTADNGQQVKAPISIPIDENGQAVVARETLTLVLASVVTGSQTAYGGDYYLRAFATAWNGASVRVQFLDLDGVTWTNLQKMDGTDVPPFTANRMEPIGIDGGAQLRAVVTGAPAGLFVRAGRVPA